MTRYPQLELDRQLCFALYAASRAVTRAYGPLLESAGLTYPQYLVLLVLWEHAAGPGETMTVGALGERLQLDSGTLTPLLKRLESAGHVTRERDPDDERRVLVALTSSGLALRDQVATVPFQLGSQFGVDLATGQRLQHELERITASLDSAD